MLVFLFLFLLVCFLCFSLSLSGEVYVEYDDVGDGSAAQLC